MGLVLVRKEFVSMKSTSTSDPRFRLSWSSEYDFVPDGVLEKVIYDEWLTTLVDAILVQNPQS